MRKVTAITGLLLLCHQAVAAERLQHEYPCMTQEDAQQVADNWHNLHDGYTDALANVSCVRDLNEYSDSVMIIWMAECGTGWDVSYTYDHNQ